MHWFVCSVSPRGWDLSCTTRALAISISLALFASHYSMQSGYQPKHIDNSQETLALIAPVSWILNRSCYALLTFSYMYYKEDWWKSSSFYFCRLMQLLTQWRQDYFVFCQQESFSACSRVTCVIDSTILWMQYTMKCLPTIIKIVGVQTKQPKTSRIIPDSCKSLYFPK